MIFESFLKGDISPFSFDDDLDLVITHLAYPQVNIVSSDNESYAVYSQGIEYLFDMKQLCLIQFEIDRVKQVFIGQNKITKNTTYEEFKKYLDQIKLKYHEESKNTQKILFINSGIKVYFDHKSNKLITALKSNE